MSSPFKHLYEFGPFTLDAVERVVSSGGETVHLTPKEFETLLALVRGGGRVMSKEELLKEIWPDTFVEEATLAQNVFTLRKALARRGGEQQFIETVPRRGYRFVAKVSERREEEEAPAATGEGAAAVESSAGAETMAGAESAGGVGVARTRGLSDAARAAEESAAGNGYGAARATATTARLSSTRGDGGAATTHGAGGHPVRAAVLISVAVVLAVSALVFAVNRLVVRRQTATPAARQQPSFHSMKVTRLPVSGTVQEAVISPDGKYLAYVAAGPGAAGAGVRVRQVEAAASNTQQIVAAAEGATYGALAFSPDSQHVYFGSWTNDDRPGTLSRVPVFGGPAEKILEGINGPVTFSPDGGRVAFMRGGVGDTMSLMVAAADGGGARALVTRRTPSIFGIPSWSPDGNSIACAYGSLENLSGSAPYLGVTAFDADDGSERQLTDARWIDIGKLAWLPDSSAIVMSAAEQELSPTQIWRVSSTSGGASRVTNDLNTYFGASLTADGSALVTVQTDRAPSVWVAPGGDAARARQITAGAGKFDGYYGVAWTPDGRIVYASIAGGSWDIWVMDADGSNQRQLTVGAKSNYGPSVSSDGRHVVFVSNRAGNAFNVWRMDADGSNPKQLTFGRGENFAHVTPDGRWVVYATVGFGQPSLIWKVPIEGGEPVRLTDRPASWPFVSPDGKFFVCTYGEGSYSTSKLAVIPIEGGRPTKLFDIPATFRANTVWMPDNRGIAFLDSRTGTTNVWMQPLAGGRPVQLTDFNNDNLVAYDWSRDNRLAATRSAETTGVVLIRDFK